MAQNKAMAGAMAGQQPTNDPLAAMDQQINAKTQVAQNLAQQGFGNQANAAMQEVQNLRGQKTQLALSRAATNSRMGNYDSLVSLAPHLGIQNATSADYDKDQDAIVLKDKDGNVVGGMPKKTMDELDWTPEQRANAAWHETTAKLMAGSRENVAKTNEEARIGAAGIAGNAGIEKANIGAAGGIERSKIGARAGIEEAHIRANAEIGGNTNIKIGGKTGPDALAELSDLDRPVVQAIVDGRKTIPSGIAQSKPYWQKIQAEVMQVDPNWSEQRAEIRKSLTVGQEGRNIRSLNIATVHLDAYMQAAEAVKNGTLQLGNALYNKISATLGSPVPTTLETIKNAVVAEQAAALKGNATEGEIDTISKNFNNANSPDQFTNSGKAALGIMYQKLNAYNEAYHQHIPQDRSWSPMLPSAEGVLKKYGVMNNPPAKTSGAGSDHPNAQQMQEGTISQSGKFIWHDGGWVGK
jgi:hypothetical protein